MILEACFIVVSHGKGLSLLQTERLHEPIQNVLFGMSSKRDFVTAKSRVPINGSNSYFEGGHK